MFALYPDVLVAGGPRFELGSRGTKSLHLAIRPPPKTRLGDGTTAALALAVFVLVRHAACFAALFLGWAAWGDDAQDSHCLQAQGETFAAVG